MGFKPTPIYIYIYTVYIYIWLYIYIYVLYAQPIFRLKSHYPPRPATFSAKWTERCRGSVWTTSSDLRKVARAVGRFREKRFGGLKKQKIGVSISSGWWFQPLWKNISQLGWLLPIYGKIKHVPNHQPDNVLWTIMLCWCFITSIILSMLRFLHVSL